MFTAALQLVSVIIVALACLRFQVNQAYKFGRTCLRTFCLWKIVSAKVMSDDNGMSKKKTVAT